MTMKTALAALTFLAAPALAAAQAVDGDTAQAQLFDSKGRTVQIITYDVLSDRNKELLQLASREQKYYAAIAMAPAEGVLAEATVAAANYHSVADADAAALRACNGRRKGGPECVVVARTVPKGHAARALELSVDATEDFRKTYRRAGAPKAMAISPATAKWAIMTGQGAQQRALDACNAQSAPLGARDCELAVID
jgi:hypothetical protein